MSNTTILDKNAFGPGAMGFTGGAEYINTCSTREYIRSVTVEQRLPIAGIRSVSKEERAVRYTNERLGALKLDLNEFKKFFKEEFNELIGRTGFRYFLRIQKLLGHIKQYKDRIELTRKGMIARNFLGCAFILFIPCSIVEKYIETPWPIQVTIPRVT